MSTCKISENSVPIAVEDKFIIFAFGKGRSLCPHSNDSEKLGEMIASLGNLIPIFDLRSLEGLYHDINIFIQNVGGDASYIMLGRKEINAGWGRELSAKGFEIIRAGGHRFKTSLLDINLFAVKTDFFADEASDQLQNDMFLSLTNPAHEYTKDLLTRERDLQFDTIKRFVDSRHRTSLLVEFVMAARDGKVILCPYHGHAIHDVEMKPKTVLVGRPAVIAQNTRAAFSDEIAALEELVNDATIKEHAIQKFLEEHPNFIRGLNYNNIYPQIVLERENDGSLIPDFILEPFEGGFCDILDIKLPKQRLYVGGKDRGQLAAGLHEVAAQLREYAAYFEQDKYRRFVRERYGLKIYRPRLIAVIGRDINQLSAEQFRRAITAYDNLQFMTFDELIRHARNRILV